jgi:hypothetical protein
MTFSPFLAVLEVEHRTIPPSLLTLVVFEIESHFMPRSSMYGIQIFVLPHIAGMTCIATTPRHWLRWGLVTIFAQAGLHQTIILPIFTSQVAGIRGLSYLACWIWSTFKKKFIICGESKITALELQKKSKLIVTFLPFFRLLTSEG